MKKFRLSVLLSLALALLLALSGCTIEIVPAAGEAPASASAQAESEALPQKTPEAAVEPEPTAEPEAQPQQTAAPAQTAAPTQTPALPEPPQEERIREDGEYTSKEDVAEYLYLYMHLPGNYITKKEAQALGWDSKKGNLKDVAPGKSIGGDRFGNYEGLLPDAKGRRYTECDIDSDGGYRNAKRIIFSNDGLIYYTEDHYQTFELLYGEE